MEQGNLTGKAAIVTGSASGIGAAVALELARRGAKVLINYSKSEREAREVADAVRRGEPLPEPSRAALLARRRATGNLGNLGLPAVRARVRRARRWAERERRRFDAAMARLAGPGRRGR